MRACVDVYVRACMRDVYMSACLCGCVRACMCIQINFEPPFFILYISHSQENANNHNLPEYQECQNYQQILSQPLHVTDGNKQIYGGPHRRGSRRKRRRRRGRRGRAVFIHQRLASASSGTAKGFALGPYVFQCSPKGRRP
ncbi:hypothetical protein EVAR_37855_1 [Eumeta japonica]|uniref:Uncharacterized protein n=1 Tax=Eumeta variegata TaxID=151549 RepID=A0A4C1X073_EUMVA|nr:hypothetical protein EVAR_37855_1 [Eumeta japonica]